MINPGNPTGQVLSKENLQEIIDLCHSESILIIADEVYQNNIYKEGIKFHSFRKVLNEMGNPYASSVELFSLNSVSKGLFGECGLRGGYMEAHNLDPQAEEQLYKMKSIELCSNTVGQIATLLLVDPPKEGRESADTLKKYKDESTALFQGLKERATLLSQSLNSMENITCTEIQGAMYGFPRLHLTQKAVDAAKAQGVAPDFMYSLELVNKTGIMTVPGSGFGQKPGEHHFRITNLVTPTERMKETLKSLHDFNAEFMAKYA